MRNYLLPLLALCLLSITSCKKDSSTTGNNNPTTVSSKDPVSLSKALKIWHGSRQPGSAPRPTGSANAPLVMPPNQNVKALSGQYAIIKPSVVSGTVAGYYVGIAGANEYFKVDYSTPRLSGRPSGRLPRRFLQRPANEFDSAIVVILPTNLQVPDTFCVTYCPYDAQGNIGQPVTTCIYVSQLGGDASTAWVAGNWRIVSYYSNNSTDTLIYNQWVSDDTKYYCQDDGQGFSTVVSYFDTTNPSIFTDLNLSDSVFRFAADLSLGSNGGMNYLDSSRARRLDFGISTCAVPVLSAAQYDTYRTIGGWSANNNSLTLVYQFDEFGQDDYSASTYTLIRPDNNTMVLVDPIENERLVLRRL